MTEPKDMIEQIIELRTAVVAAATLVVAREKDGSFLEKTLRDALAAQLPRARTEVRLNLARWTGRLGGVDVVYVNNDGRRVGVETKVWDVADSLFDIFKLAVAAQRGALATGVAVIAGRTRDWDAPSAIRDMSTAAPSTRATWATTELLRSDARSWTRIWSRSSARPQALPTHLETLTVEPVPMVRAPGHEIRIIGVQAVGPGQVAVDEAGRITHEL
jgi:hypothetical protein